MLPRLASALALGVALSACGLGLSGEGASGDVEQAIDAGPPATASLPPGTTGGATALDAASSGSATGSPSDSGVPLDAPDSAPVSSAPPSNVDGGDDGAPGLPGAGGGPGDDEGGPGKSKGGPK